ncbi:MAG: S-methyl-5-thioribose-1-phosphate isomerase [Clostridia bacterium]|nr:S-methyl-5-thioribose-1-phosphate isomerase [Clostridia bacterium]
MLVNGENYRTVWMQDTSVFMIEQNLLPFRFEIVECKDYEQTCVAIKTMVVRGAGALGAAAGFAMAQAFLQNKPSEFVDAARRTIEATRPTARNLFYAVERVYRAGLTSPQAAADEAQAVADNDAADSQAIGRYGNELIKNGFRILTHCNAGWLAFVDYGTALSPIYQAHEQGKNVFVWVDETRPRSQGARLTAWELNNAKIPHRIIADNAAAWLMAQGKVDMVITGADRIAANGDTANKIGTLGKALAAHTFGIPFYIAAPLSTFDRNCKTGIEITIENRNQDEVLFQEGPDAQGVVHRICVASPGSGALNPAFDITPARFITGIITEKGIIKPDAAAIAELLL